MGGARAPTRATLQLVARCRAAPHRPPCRPLRAQVGVAKSALEQLRQPKSLAAVRSLSANSPAVKETALELKFMKKNWEGASPAPLGRARHNCAPHTEPHLVSALLPPQR